jgi:DNA-binding transcriptional MerR regulator
LISQLEDSDAPVSQAAAAIPEKLFFKIGEVCEIAGVQAHVLRYWETEFPMLAPQKNRAGQRTYRRRDVEMALRIKELLYEEQYTIAGAKKKLASELRAPVRDKIVGADSAKSPSAASSPRSGRSPATPSALRSDKLSAANVPTDQRAALREIAAELREILDLLDSDDEAPKSSRR